MVNTVQHKRGTTSQVNSYTGAVGEFIYNTTTKRIHAQDGVTAGGGPHALVSEVNLKANESVTISSGAGLTGGGTLAANRTLALSSASIASLALADSAVQSVNGKTGSSITLTKADVGLGNVDNTSDASKPISTATQTALNAKANSSVTVSAGAGLTGGGNLTANRSIALNAASIASLGKADTALQAPGGTTGQILAKNSNTTNDVGWVSSEAATAVSYGPQALTDAQKSQARANIDADKVYNSVSDVQSSVINSSVMAIRTNGYHSAGDGGGALYKRVASEPSHAGKFQSADGAWWEIAESIVSPMMFGAKGDDSTDDTVAVQAAMTSSAPMYIDRSYLISAAATYSGTTAKLVFGKGSSSSKITMTNATQHGLVNSGSAPLIVRDLSITTSVDKTAGYAIDLGTAGRSMVDNCHIFGTADKALYNGINCGGVIPTIRSNYLLTIKGTAIDINNIAVGGGGEVSIFGNTFNTTTPVNPSANGSVAIYHGNGVGPNLIHDNRFQNYDYAIVCSPSSVTSSCDFLITGNSFIGHKTTAINLSLPTGSTTVLNSIIICNNDFRMPVGRCVVAVGASNPDWIEKLVFDGNTVYFGIATTVLLQAGISVIIGGSNIFVGITDLTPLSFSAAYPRFSRLGAFLYIGVTTPYALNGNTGAYKVGITAA